MKRKTPYSYSYKNWNTSRISYYVECLCNYVICSVELLLGLLFQFLITNNGRGFFFLRRFIEYAYMQSALEYAF